MRAFETVAEHHVSSEFVPNLLHTNRFVLGCIYKLGCGLPNEASEIERN